MEKEARIREDAPIWKENMKTMLKRIIPVSLGKK